MLHEFLTNNQYDIIDRCRAKVEQRPTPKLTAGELEHGIPLFLAQLIKTLQVEQSAEPSQSRKISGPSGGANPALSEVGQSAALHGRELLLRGFSVEQVVHDYGDLCQAVTDLAFDRQEPISIDEFRTLNRCLDNAIADAVTEFVYQRDAVVAEKQATELTRRLGFLAHELRNHLGTAMAALVAIKTGYVAISGATGTILDRSLISMGNLIDRSLAEVRITSGLVVHHQLFSLAEFIAEVKISASLEAEMRECTLTVSEVEFGLALDCDRELLFSAVGNLLQNAFKFTQHGTEVTLNSYASGDRILIDVQDNCGGLPPGFAEVMFQPFIQGGADRSGLGLGLSISQRSVEANDGILGVRNVPDIGCVFTIDLPRHAMPAPSL